MARGVKCLVWQLLVTVMLTLSDCVFFVGLSIVAACALADRIAKIDAALLRRVLGVLALALRRRSSSSVAARDLVIAVVRCDIGRCSPSSPFLATPLPLCDNVGVKW